jgi:DNA-binding NtrC family response regulator
MKKNNGFTIFIVDDDPWYGTLLEHFLKLNNDYKVERFESGADLLANLYKMPQVITVDFAMPGMDGGEVLKRIKEQLPDVPVIIISGQGEVKVAVSLLKKGAFDYIVKDDDTTDRLWNTILHIREMEKLRDEVATLKTEVGKKYSFQHGILGQSPPMMEVFKLMEKAAQTNITVSISGDTGTGKELVAKGIHYNSIRKSGPFVAVNMAAIPSELLESELFGYEKGAFTGANNRKLGKFEEASGGTLFLDEIADLDLGLQAKLLRALQERTITRLGGNKEIPIDVRIIIATHHNLKIEASEKKFREDLYYRLLGLPINLPPLRERGQDIVMLARHFVKVFCNENSINEKSISKNAIAKLMNYHFPGNVRELKSLMELGVVLCNGDTIEDSDLNTQAGETTLEMLTYEKTLKEYEEDIIKHYLKKYNSNVLLVAEKLNIGKSTIYRMLQSKKIPAEFSGV